MNNEHALAWCQILIFGLLCLPGLVILLIGEIIRLNRVAGDSMSYGQLTEKNRVYQAFQQGPSAMAGLYITRIAS